VVKINSQLSIEEKKEYADRLIVNEESKEELKAEILSIWREINAKGDSFNCS
jgi:dephospho-CoA kinase